MNNSVLSWIGDETLLQGLVAEQSVFVLLVIIVICITMLSLGADWMIDGVVDLAGSLQINPDKTYAFLGQIVSKSNTPDALLQRIRFLPEGDRPGQHELRLEGSY